MSLQIEKFIEEFKKSPDIMKEKVIDFFQYLKYIETEKKWDEIDNNSEYDLLTEEECKKYDDALKEESVPFTKALKELGLNEDDV